MNFVAIIVGVGYISGEVAVDKLRDPVVILTGVILILYGIYESLHRKHTKKEGE